MFWRLVRVATAAFLCVSLSAWLVTSRTSAQTPYPNRSIELWVGYSAGSGTDTHARLLAAALRKQLGQPVAVVNKGGAGGVVMWTELARARADGYTLGIINLPALPAAAATVRLAFDPLKDLTYIGNASADAVTLAFNPKGPYGGLEDVIRAAKQNPGKISVGITGRGSQDYLTARSVEKEAGVRFKYVSFEGTSEGINAILGGHLDLMGMVVSSAAPFYKSGQLGMLAVGTDERLADFPDVPTFKEKGIDLFGGGALNYKALGAPAGLPEDVKARLTAALRAAVADPEFVAKVQAIGSMPHFLDGPELERLAAKHIELAKEFISN